MSSIVHFDQKYILSRDFKTEILSAETVIKCGGILKDAKQKY